MDNFQSRLWRERATIGGLKGVIDASDEKGLKNKYIDLCHKVVLGRELQPWLGDKVLDFGCGTGRITNWLSDKYAVAVGVDFSLDMIRTASATSWGTAEFIPYDGVTLPFCDCFFDKSLSVWVMQHIIDLYDLLATLQEIRRVLVDGGKFVLIEQVRAKTSSEVYPGTDEVYKIFRSPEEYIWSFDAAGFKVQRHGVIGARKGLGARVVEMGYWPKWAEKAIRPMVYLDLWCTHRVKVPADGYIDYLFVLEKA